MAGTPSARQVCAPCAGQDLTIDLDALFSELAAQPQAGGDGFTTGEIMEKLGKGREAARKFIAQAQRSGRCRVTRKQVVDLAGVLRNVPAYAFS